MAVAGDRRPLMREVFLLLLANPRWWSGPEIRRAIIADETQISPQLYYATRRFGTLAQKGSGRAIRYAVTKRCRIPHGIELKDLEKALQKRAGREVQ